MTADRFECLVCGPFDDPDELIFTTSEEDDSVLTATRHTCGKPLVHGVIAEGVD